MSSDLLEPHSAGIVLCVSIFATQLVSFIASDSGSIILNFLANISIGIQLVVFLHASGDMFGNRRTEQFYDLTGSSTCILINLLAISSKLGTNITDDISTRQIFVAAMALLWALRLGTFLFLRINSNNGVDSRFVKIKKDVFYFMIVWILQGVWAFMANLPVLVLNCGVDYGPSSLVAMDYFGIAVWFAGFVFECIADHQKLVWASTPGNRSRFISTGLWSISRHPNYFGEICLWMGIFITASTGFGRIGQWISILSPIFTAYLLINVSGINILEASAEKKWGFAPDYVSYKRNVPVLIPFFGRTGDEKF